jgi:hypothetical protein
MKVILDKSVLVAANEQTLCQFIGNGRFVLTPMLRYEAATGTAVQKCKTTLRNLTGYWLSDLDILIRWEIEKGRSVSEAETFWNSPPFLDDGILEVDTEKINDYENGWARLADIKAAPEDADAVKNIRRMQKPKFYQFLESKQATLPLAKMARESWAKEGKVRGIKVSKKFKPQQNWLCYGLELVSNLSLYWKLWRYDNAIADKKKPANFGIDLIYVAFLSIADGLLSAEPKMLGLAWACWPKKRSCLFFYNMKVGTIEAYSPAWAITGQPDADPPPTQC